jgi:hypothetical protein
MVRMPRSLCRLEDGWRRDAESYEKERFTQRRGGYPSNAAYFATAAAFFGGEFDCHQSRGFASILNIGV